LLAYVATSPHVAADGTPMPVFDEHATRKGWMWVFATADALLFAHWRTRRKSVPKGALGFTTGTLTVNGNTAYNSVIGQLGRKRGGCWCHARRGLYNVLRYDEAFIQPLLDKIGEIFYIEAQVAGTGIVGTAEHLALRKEKSKPIIYRQFVAWDDYDATAVDARSSTSKAVSYIINQRVPLQLIWSFALVPIHNILSERALRVIALTRKTRCSRATATRHSGSPSSCFCWSPANCTMWIQRLGSPMF
jgi:transposase